MQVLSWKDHGLLMTSQQLKEARLKTGFTQKRMALYLGMMQQAYGLLENGKRRITKIHAASVDMLVVISKAGLLEKLDRH